MFDQSQIQEFKEVGQLPLGLWEVTGMHGKPLDVGSALSPWGVVKSFLEAARLQLSPTRCDELPSGSPTPSIPESLLCDLQQAFHSSTLAWKIPWTEQPGRLQSMGSLRVGHN